MISSSLTERVGGELRCATNRHLRTPPLSTRQCSVNTILADVTHGAAERAHVDGRGHLVGFGVCDKAQ